MASGTEVAAAYVSLGYDSGTAKARMMADDAAFKRMAGSAGLASSKTSALGAIASKQSRNLDALGTAAKRVALVGFGALAYGIANTIKVGMQYEEQMSRVKAVSGATGKEMAQLSAIAKKLGADTKFSAGEAADAMYQLSSAGFKVNQIGKVLPGTLSLAAASNIELADAAEISSNALRGFGLASKDSKHVSDVLAQSVNSSSVEMNDLQLSLKYIGPIAKATGQKFETMIAAVGEMGDAGIKGEQAGTSLRAAMLSLTNPVGQAEKALGDMGLTAKDLQGPNGLLPLPKIIALLQDGMDGMDKASQNAALSMLFGREAASGMFTIIDGGAPKLAKLTKELENSDGAAKNAAKTMQDNLAGSWEQLGGSIETVQIDLYEKFEKPLKDSLDEATSYVNKKGPVIQEAISSIVDTPEFKKADLVGKFRIIGDAIEPALIDGVNAAIPLMAEALGKGAWIGAKAFARGFVEADIWGKLFLGTWFLNALGGKALIGAVGTTAAKAFATRFMPSLAAEIAAAGGLGGLLMKGAGPVAAIVAVNEAFKKLGSDSKDGWHPFDDLTQGTQLEDIAAGLGLIDSKADKLRNAFKGIDGEMPEFILNLHKVGSNAQQLATGLDITRDSIKATKQSVGFFGDELDDAARRMEKFEKQVRKSSGDVRGSIKDAGKGISEFATGSGSDFDKVGGKSGSMSGKVDGNVSSMANAVKDALDAIASNTNEALKGFGVDKIAFSFKTVGKAAQGKQKGGVIHAQTGVMVPGFGDGDKVPAMLEPGEVVINKRAVAAMGGANKANAINSKIPRFATGGIIQQALGPYDMPPVAYDANHAGGKSHLHMDFFTNAQAQSIGQKMQSMGWRVSEFSGGPNPGNFGPVTVQHQSSGHYDGTAFDANTAADETRSEVAAVVKLLGGSGGVGGFAGAVAEKIKALTLQGPKGPLTDIGQGALDKVRSAANKFISSKQPKVGGGVSDISTGGGSTSANAKLGHRMMLDSGWGEGEWSSLNALWTGESGWNELADNPTSDAYGIPQSLPGSKMASAGSDWLTNPATQIKWGLGYIRERYGSPGGAYSAWQSRSPHWYQQGGIVEKFAKGGIPEFGPGGSGGGPFKGITGKDLKTIGGKKAGKRRHALKDILKGIAGIGLPKALTDKQAALAGTADEAMDYADRASSLGIDNPKNADGSPLMQDGKVVDFVEGSVNGDSETGWLTKELQARFEMRNTIIAAQEKIGKKVEQVHKMREAAKGQLIRIGAALRQAENEQEALLKEREKVRQKVAEAKEDLRKELDKAKGKGEALADAQKTLKQAQGALSNEMGKKNPDAGTIREQQRIIAGQTNRIAKIQGGDNGKAISEAQDKITHGQGRIENISAKLGQLGPQIASRGQKLGALKEKILPAFKDQESGLKSAGGTLTEDLDVLQGHTPLKGKLAVLPAKGLLGGDIFNLQDKLDALNARPRLVDPDSDNSSAETSVTDNNAELLALEREKNLVLQKNLNVSQMQNPIFQNFANLPAFAEGGKHYGGLAMIGEKGPELMDLSPGQIFSNNQSQGMLAGGNVSVAVYLYGDDRAMVDVNGREFEVAVQKVNTRTAKIARHSTPGIGAAA